VLRRDGNRPLVRGVQFPFETTEETMKTRALGVAALTALGVLVFDCQTQPPLVAVSGTADGGIGGGGAVEVQLVTLSDAQSAAVLSSLNLGEVRVAQAVQSRLTNADAQAFAQRMITEHTGVNATAADLVNQQGITPQSNGVSMGLDFATQQTIASLQGLSGSALDAAYMASQMQMHQQALAVIDCVVMPSLVNSPMRSFVTGTVRPGEVEHLTSAESISTSLGGTAGAGTPGAESDCSRVCVPGGLLTDTVRAGACIAQ
jgi:putative membrane protein